MAKKPSRKKKTEFNDTFFLTMIGELVQIYCRDVFKNSGLPILGYILDIDDDYFYIGDSPEEIVRCIKKSDVFMLEIYNEADESLRILENMEIPEDETSKN